MADKMKASSFSRASDFERCKLFAKFRHIDKIPDPRPVDPTKEHPLDRGNRLHKLAEHYVGNGLMTIPDELREFKDRLDSLRKAHEAGLVTLEARLAFDDNWQPCEYFGERVIYRAIADVTVRPEERRIMICDYKTGKKDGNEIKHHEQCMEYACCYATIYPEIQLFQLQIWYFDQPRMEGNPTIRNVTRTEVLKYFKTMQARHKKVVDCRHFPAEPSQFACRFCPYKAGTVGRGKLAYPGTGHCRRNVN